MQRYRIIIALFLAVPSIALATFTEFYCDFTNGNNTNGGSSTATSVYTSTNGNWNGSSTFTPTDGSNPATASPACTVGDFGSVYLDGASVAVYIARITAVTNATNGAITLSTTSKAGTAPTSGATGRTIKCGGVWKGPNSGSGFPITFSGTTLSQATNSAGDQVRVNFKNNATYAITSGITGTNQSTELLLQGYGSSVGDGGKATIDGGGNGLGTLLTLGQRTDLFDFIVSNVGVSAGTGTGIGGGVADNSLFRVVVHDVRGGGIIMSSIADCQLIECEVYNYNLSNTASQPGISLGTGDIAKRCYVHDGSGSNCDGIQTVSGTGNNFIDQCVLDTNGGNGILISGGSSASMHYVISNCDFYNNTGAGIKVGTPAGFYVLHIENNNFVKNGTYGIDGGSGFSRLFGYMLNNGYGAGTQANSSGNYHTTGSLILDDNTGTNSRVVYANDVTPWVNPANGNFSINLATAEGVARGAFTQTDGSNTGTVGYPDIGAAQAQIGEPFPTPTATPTSTPTPTTPPETSHTFGG